MGLPWWLRKERICLQYRRPRFNPGLERSLEKEMATLSSILAWRIPWTEEPGGLQSMRLQESDTTEGLTHTHSHNMWRHCLEVLSPLFFTVLLDYVFDEGIVKAIGVPALTLSSLVGVLTEHKLPLTEAGCRFLPLAPRCSWPEDKVFSKFTLFLYFLLPLLPLLFYPSCFLVPPSAILPWWLRL